MSYLIGEVKDCIVSATALTEADAPYSEEIASSLRKTSSSVASVAQRICEISGAAVIASSSSLAEMINDLKNRWLGRPWRMRAQTNSISEQHLDFVMALEGLRRLSQDLP